MEGLQVTLIRSCLRVSRIRAVLEFEIFKRDVLYPGGQALSNWNHEGYQKTSSIPFFDHTFLLLPQDDTCALVRELIHTIFDDPPILAFR